MNTEERGRLNGIEEKWIKKNRVIEKREMRIRM